MRERNFPELDKESKQIFLKLIKWTTLASLAGFLLPLFFAVASLLGAILAILIVGHVYSIFTYFIYTLSKKSTAVKSAAKGFHLTFEIIIGIIVILSILGLILGGSAGVSPFGG